MLSFTQTSLLFTHILCQDDDEWDRKVGPVHLRAARWILDGCLKNGGLYIKLGQGLVSMNHLLPKEYLQTLEVLQDQALPRTSQEVSAYDNQGQ